MDQSTMSVVLIAAVGMIIFLAASLVVVSKKVKNPSTNDNVIDHPSILIINTIMLALDLCQETLIRLRSASKEKAPEEVFNLFFEEIYSFIIKNEDQFDPIAMRYFHQIDKVTMANITFNIINHFINQLDNYIPNKDEVVVVDSIADVAAEENK